MTDEMNIPDPPVRVDGPIIHRKISPVAGCSLDQFDNLGLIIGMNALTHCFEWRRLFSRFETYDAEALFAPVPEFVRCGIPGPTARVAQPLRFRQVGFTLPERRFGSLAFRDIH